MNTQENRIKVFVNDSRENYSFLTYSVSAKLYSVPKKDD